jgi:type IV pilus assembly protein PilY1
VDDERPDGDTTTRRPSLHGDVVHSRPVAINYGDFASPEVVVFYSGNDGVLRAINGNRSSTIGSVPAGRELWSFVPPEFFKQIKRIRENDTQYKFFGNDDVDAKPKPYGLDGSITSYIDDDNTWLYVTARRGGRVLYAFDVTDITTTPSSPTLMWKVGCPNLDDDVGCTSAAFEALGQTWSPARHMKTPYSSKLLIMGGGYDPCEDEDPISAACLSSTKGNRVYILNAETGAVVKSFTTDRGVPAEVFVVTDKSSVEGYAKHAYVVDLGGNVYRISDAGGEAFGDDPLDWQMEKIAALGCAARTDTCYRKFMFMPDVVEKGDVYYLMVGSGDREKPLKDYTHALSVENYFFMLKDNPTDPDWLPGDGCDESDGLCLDALLPIGADDPEKSDLASHKGWYLELEAGEKVVTSAITVYGTATFSTHTPADPEPGSCTSNLGTAKVYNIFYANAKTRNGTANRYEVVVGGGLPPSPVAGLVWLDGMDPVEDEPMPFIIGADPTSPLEGRRPTAPSTTNQPKSLTYWFIEK